MQRLFLTLILFHTVTFMTSAQEVKPEVKKPKIKIEKIDEHRLAVGKVTIDKKAQTLSFPASLGNPEAVIEYLIVNQHGKTHETLFLTETQPLHINIAMKLLGYKPSKELFPELDDELVPTGKMITETYEVKTAARFDIFVEWNDGKSDRSHHINEFIYNSVSKKAAETLPYIYCGSYLIEGAFQADIDGDLVAILTNPAAIGNFSNEGRNDDTIWYPNTKRLPKKDTPISLVFKKHKTLKNK